jgi:hypothetical protein
MVSCILLRFAGIFDFEFEKMWDMLKCLFWFNYEKRKSV